MAKWTCSVATVCHCATSCFLFVNGQMSVFCVVGLVAAVLLTVGAALE